MHGLHDVGRIRGIISDRGMFHALLLLWLSRNNGGQKECNAVTGNDLGTSIINSQYKPRLTRRERPGVAALVQGTVVTQLTPLRPFLHLDPLLGFSLPCPVYSPEPVQLPLQLPLNPQSIIPMYQTSLAAFPVVLPHAALPPSLRRRTRFKKRPVFAL